MIDAQNANIILSNKALQIEHTLARKALRQWARVVDFDEIKGKTNQQIADLVEERLDAEGEFDLSLMLDEDLGPNVVPDTDPAMICTTGEDDSGLVKWQIFACGQTFFEVYDETGLELMDLRLDAEESQEFIICLGQEKITAQDLQQIHEPNKILYKHLQAIQEQLLLIKDLNPNAQYIHDYLNEFKDDAIKRQKDDIIKKLPPMYSLRDSQSVAIHALWQVYGSGRVAKETIDHMVERIKKIQPRD